MRIDRSLGPWRVAARRAATGVALATASIAAAAAPTAAQTASYLDFEELTSELRSLADGSDAARLRSLASTRTGRDVWLVELGAPGGPPLDERPAVLVVGNLQGDHVLGSQLALEVVRHLLSGDPDARRTLEERTVYVVPRLNPDGAEAMFAAVRRDRTRNARPRDDDNDGRVDEDGPEDLNGDGLITAMRVVDPEGPYAPRDDEPRLMKRADPAAGEEAGWAVYWEGVDSDGDGFLNEDGPGGVDLDRNFQHAYPYWEADAGRHMVSEPETRALMDFTVAHPNVAAILTFGTSDNLVTPPDQRGQLASPATLDLTAFADAADDGVFDVGIAPGAGGGGGFRFFRSGFRGAQPGRDNDPDSGRRPATTVNGSDREYFEAVSEAYREITGIEKLGVRRAPEGAFFEYGYFQFGVPSFSTPGWGLPEASAEEGDAGQEEAAAPAGRRPGGPARQGGGGATGTDATVLAALEAAGIDAFVPWTEYDHPTLGTVEIGGFRPYAVTNPPAEQLPELGEAHGRFVVRLADMLPRVRIAATEVTELGGGVYRVEAAVENGGYFPTSTRHGLTCRCVDPVSVQIQVEPAAIVTGDPKTATVRSLDGSRGRESFTWVVRGRSGQQIEIRVRSTKGGHDTATVTLR